MRETASEPCRNQLWADRCGKFLPSTVSAFLGVQAAQNAAVALFEQIDQQRPGEGLAVGFLDELHDWLARMRDASLSRMSADDQRDYAVVKLDDRADRIERQKQQAFGPFLVEIVTFGEQQRFGEGGARVESGAVWARRAQGGVDIAHGQ